jgi:peptide/nickel transport system permease protein
MLEVMDQDYIRTARAKGVLEKDVINKHALRNALLPTSNLIIGGTASALLGSLFVEVTFNYKGFGWHMVESIFKGDYLLINGLLVFSVIIILIGTLVTDVMYTIIDPRIVYR